MDPIMLGSYIHLRLKQHGEDYVDESGHLWRRVQLFGMPIAVDSTIPRDEVQLRQDGKVVARITNISHDSCPSPSPTESAGGG